MEPHEVIAHDVLDDLMERDRPAWVLTTARAYEVMRATEKAGFDWANGDPAELRRIIHGLWPDLAWVTIEEGFRYAAYEDPVGIDPVAPEECVLPEHHKVNPEHERFPQHRANETPCVRREDLD